MLRLIRTSTLEKLQIEISRLREDNYRLSASALRDEKNLFIQSKLIGHYQSSVDMLLETRDSAYTTIGLLKEQIKLLESKEGLNHEPDQESSGEPPVSER